MTRPPIDFAADGAAQWRDTGDPTQLILDLMDPDLPMTMEAREIIARCLMDPPKRTSSGRPHTVADVFRVMETVDIWRHAAEIRKEEPTIPAERLIADIAEERGIPESRVSAALYPRKKSR